MDELFYFPTFDLLTKIVYAKEANSLRYASHRALTADEKKVIERYILQEVAPKTDYYKRSPSLLLYMGVDLSLKKELKAYQVKDTIRSILNHKQEIEEKVQMLISDSLSAYYFDRLGDRLLELKNLLSGDAEAEAVEFAKLAFCWRATTNTAAGRSASNLFCPARSSAVTRILFKAPNRARPAEPAS